MSDEARPATDLGPLPAGHHGLSPEQVAESQRERLLAAVAHVATARGYQDMTITEIARTAAVANRVFYANFASKEEACLASFEAVVRHLEDQIAAAAAAQPDWPQKVIAALRVTLELFAPEPDLARLCLVVPLTATPAIGARFREAVDVAIPHLRSGRSERPEAEALPPFTEDGVLGGLVRITTRSLLADATPLDALLPDLVDFALSPYLGAAAARQLAAQAAGPAARSGWPAQ
jgi:AcrR family transcriptional regulator